MPILSFRCKGCAVQWDEIAKLEDNPPCRKCGSDQVDSLITYGAAPRGSFGTTRRNSAGEAAQEFNFTSEEEQLEFDFNKKSE